MRTRPNSDRARNAIIFLYIIIVIGLISTFSEIMQYVLLSGDFTMEEAESNDTRQMFIGALEVISTIITAVMFIMWFRRSYWNLHQVKPGSLSHAEGWAAGAWFVPILNLFRPYQIMKEINLVYNKLTGSDQTDRNNSIIGIWWTFWVVGSLVSNFSTRMYMKAESIQQIQSSSILTIISGGLIFVAGVMAVMVVKAVSDLETKFAQGVTNEDITQHLISDEENGFN